ncbi:MAG: O-antigen ligase family protein [Coriobacteriia bacterium]|nr:O-antigen ligase family protein [Coriobacteriia bacterium]
MANWLFDDDLTLEGKIAWATLLLLVFLVPLTFSIPPSSGVAFTADIFDTPKVWVLRVGVMILFAAWGSDVALNGTRIHYKKIVLILLGLLSIVFIASTITSIEPMLSFLGKYRRYDGLWSFLLFVILMWVTWQYATEDHRIKQIMQVFSVSSVLVAGYGLLQALGLEPFSWGEMLFEANRSFSTYGNPNLLAGFLAFGIFINLGLAISENEQIPKVYYWVATLLNVMVSITAFSRSVWVASVVGLALFVLLTWRMRPPLQRIDYLFASSTFLGAAIFIIRSLGSTSKVMNFASRVTSIFDFGAGSAVTRFQIWEAALEAIRQRPLLGWGPDTFRMVFRLFQPVGYNQAAGYRSVADNAHNYLLQVAAGIGILGVVLLYGVQLSIIVLSMRSLWMRPQLDESETSKKGKQRAIERYDAEIGTHLRWIGVLAAAVTYIVHLFFGISVPGVTFLLWIAFGILMVPVSEKRDIAPLARTNAYAVCAVLIVLALGASTFASMQLWGDHYFTRAMYASRSGDIDDSLSSITTSMRLAPRNDQYAIRNVEFIMDAASQGLLPVTDAICATETLIQSFPNEYDVHLMVLWAYRSLGQVDDAIAQRARSQAVISIEKFPQGLALRYAYAELLIDDGQIDEAIEQLEFCVDADPRFNDAKDLLEKLQSVGS